MHETKLHGVKFTLEISCLHSHVLDFGAFGSQVGDGNDHIPLRMYLITKLYNLKLLKLYRYSLVIDSLSSMCKFLDFTPRTKHGLKW